MKFPENFLIGGATADFQFEGGYGEGGRGLLSHDFETTGSVDRERQITIRLADGSRGSVGYRSSLPDGAEACMYEDVYYPSHRAVDFYHRWKEDIELMAEMGFKVFRFSICWSRIFPTGEETVPNEKGLRFYENVIDELLAHGIQPLITICHDELPYYLCRTYDGWSSRHVIDCYVKYAVTLFERFKGKVKYWLTFNEINAVSGYAQIGTHKQDFQTRYQAAHHMFLASSLAIREGRRIMPDAMFGTMYASSELYPATCKPEDVFETAHKRKETLFFIDVMARGYYPNYSDEIFKRKHISLHQEPGDAEILRENTIDYVAFSYYRSTTVHQNSTFDILGGDLNPYLKATPWGWSVDPLGLRYCLNEYFDRYQKPIFIVENGMGMIDELTDDGRIHDDYRIDYVKEHLKAVRDAINIDKIPVLGYTMWGSTDLISLSTGEMKKRYGYIYVDMNDQGRGSLNRIRKDSFYWIKKVIETNGEALDE